MPKYLRIDPGICPVCRSVRTMILEEHEKSRKGQCRSCQQIYIQQFESEAHSESPIMATDEKGNILWSSSSRI